jgi:hypothetical protein
VPRSSPVAGRNKPSSFTVPSRLWLMGQPCRLTLRAPLSAGVGDGLERTKLILGPDLQPQRLSELRGPLD